MTYWPKAMSTLAPAKLNLYLDVLGKRSDGYHDIETLMLPVSLCDELEIIVSHPGSSRISLATSGINIDCQPSQNLAYRAAELFFRQVSEFDVSINLHKNIPSGAGLGGGSSDAAAVLLALNGIMEKDLQLSFNNLLTLASKLGSDVPFFLYNSAAICKGRGEIVEPLNTGSLPCNWFLIAVPPVHIRTADVYAAWASGAQIPSPYEGARGFIQSWQRNTGTKFHNSLWRAAMCVWPEMDCYINILPELSWTMTGSGSAFFAPVKHPEQAKRVIAQIPPGIDFSTFLVSTWMDSNLG